MNEPRFEDLSPQTQRAVMCQARILLRHYMGDVQNSHGHTLLNLMTELERELVHSPTALAHLDNWLAAHRDADEVWAQGGPA